ncbi:MAG TPA: hypothetical protein VFM51_04975 [Solirubrobacterales bacterium]|nr:hypothetical protein [Solirubrobacterales bacterium]
MYLLREEENWNCPRAWGSSAGLSIRFSVDAYAETPSPVGLVTVYVPCTTAEGIAPQFNTPLTCIVALPEETPVSVPMWVVVCVLQVTYPMSGTLTVAVPPSEFTVPFVLEVHSSSKVPGWWIVTNLVQLLTNAVEGPPVRVEPVNGLVELPSPPDEVHVFWLTPSVSFRSIEDPLSRLAVPEMDSLFVVPPTSNVVADAVPALTNASRAIADTAGPRCFTYFM